MASIVPATRVVCQRRGGQLLAVGEISDGTPAQLATTGDFGTSAELVTPGLQCTMRGKTSKRLDELNRRELIVTGLPRLPRREDSPWTSRSPSR